MYTDSRVPDTRNLYCAAMRTSVLHVCYFHGFMPRRVPYATV